VRSREIASFRRVMPEETDKSGVNIK